MSEKPIRRIVTGHDAQGRAVFQEDGPVPRVQRVGGEHGLLFFEVWNTQEMPARIDATSGEPAEEGLQLAPPRNGTRIRVLDIPPDGDRLDNISPEEARAHFAEVGAGDAASNTDESARHAHMHRTETVDYGIVLEGELTLILDEGETVCRTGDIIVQRGTNHGWANRSDSDCRIAFILIDGSYAGDLV